MPCNGGPWGSGDDGQDRRDAEKFERQACAARWLALQLDAVLMALDYRYAPELKKAIEKVRKEQLAHRRADRNEVLRKIVARLEDLTRQDERVRKLGGVPSGKNAREAVRWRREAKRIRAMTEEQLLETYYGNEPRYKELD